MLTVNRSGGWVISVALCLISVAVWQVGSASFRFDHHPDSETVHLRDMHAEQWKVSGSLENIQFSEEGITLSLQGAGLTRVQTSLSPESQAALIDSTLDENKESFIRVSGVMHRISEAKQYNRAAMRPTFVLRTKNSDGEVQSSSLVRARGLDRSQDFSVVLPVKADVSKIEIFWRLKSTGIWQLRDVQIRAQVQSRLYPWVLNILLVSAAALFIAGAVVLVRSLPWLRASLIALLVPLTVSLAIVARPQLKQLWTDVVLWFSSNTQMTIPLAAFEVQKIGHFLVFFLITLLMLRGRHLLRLGVIESCAIVLSLGLFTEALQNHSFTRNPSLTDVGIDASGILLAMLTWRLTSATHKRQPRTP